MHQPHAKHGRAAHKGELMNKVLGLVGILTPSLLLLVYNLTASPSVSAEPTLANPAQLAPWFITTVDAVGDVGRFASLVLHPVSGLPYVVYLRASDGLVEAAHFTPGAGNCVPNTDWTCGDN